MVGRHMGRHDGDIFPLYRVRLLLLPGVPPDDLPVRELLTKEDGMAFVAVQLA
jgi:hypothetical protein